MRDSDYVALIAMAVILVGTFVLIQSSKTQKTLFITPSGVPNSVAEGYIPSVASAIDGDVPVFDSFGNLRDSSFFISDQQTSKNALWSGQHIQDVVNDALQNQLNDSAVAPNSTWSSSAIMTNLTAVADALKPAGGVAGNLSNYSASGNLQDSGLRVDDAAAASTNVLWSSDGVLGNIIRDSLLSSNSTWSSQKLNSVFVQKDLNQSKGIMMGTGDGNIASSNLIIDDSLGPSANVLWSSDKIQPKISGVPNHLVSLGSTGTGIIDSSFSVNDSAPASNTVIWTSSKIPQIEDTSVKSSATWSSKQIVDTIQAAANVLNQNSQVTGASGNLASISSSGTLIDSGVSALSFQTRDVSAKDNDIAVFKNGTTVDSGFFVNDAAASSPNVLWTSARFKGSPGSLVVFDSQGELAPSAISMSSLPSIQSIQTGNLLTGSGSQIIDSGVTISDAGGGSSSVVWTSQGVLTNVLKDSETANSSTWSSSKIVSELAASKGTVLLDNSTSGSSTWSSDKIAAEIASSTNVSRFAGQLLTGDQSGNIVGSGFTVSDVAPASNTALWSSEKITSLFPNETTNGIVTTSNGSLTASGFVVDDSSQGANTLWSAAKISSAFLPRVSGPVGNILTSGSNGIAQTSAFSVNDSSSANSNVLWSSNKIANSFLSRVGSPNSIVSFDANGNVASTLSVQDGALGTGILWSSSQIQSKLDAINQFATSYSVNDGTTTGTNLWTAQQIQTSINNAVAVQICFDATSDQSFSSLNTPITYNILTLNVGNAFNAGSGIFTAPKRGYYFLHWQGVQNDNQGLDVRVFMKKNGSTVMGSYSYQTRHNQLVMSCVQNLQAGDRIWAELNQGSISSTSSDLFTKFSGFLMG
jgi:hypothetical protein